MLAYLSKFYQIGEGGTIKGRLQGFRSSRKNGTFRSWIACSAKGERHPKHKRQSNLTRKEVIIMDTALNTDLWSDFSVEELEARTEYGWCFIFDIPGPGWCFIYNW